MYIERHYHLWGQVVLVFSRWKASNCSVRLLENDEGQQSGASPGCLRNHGQRYSHLLRQDWHTDHEPDDGGTGIRWWHTPQNCSWTWSHQTRDTWSVGQQHLHQLCIHHQDPGETLTDWSYSPWAWSWIIIIHKILLIYKYCLTGHKSCFYMNFSLKSFLLLSASREGRWPAPPRRQQDWMFSSRPGAGIKEGLSTNQRRGARRETLQSLHLQLLSQVHEHSA